MADKLTVVGKVAPGGRYPAAEGRGGGRVEAGTVFEWTGEFRFPRAGEWFLSGAIVEAYYARTTITTEYHIAAPIRTVQLIVTVEADDEPEDVRDFVRSKLEPHGSFSVDLPGQ